MDVPEEERENTGETEGVEPLETWIGRNVRNKTLGAVLLQKENNTGKKERCKQKLDAANEVQIGHQCSRTS